MGNRAGWLKKLIPIALIGVIVVSAGMLLKEHLDTREQIKTDQELAEQVMQTKEETSAPDETDQSRAYVSPIDFDMLLAKNPDTIGWISIPDTNINYPIVQGEDNDKYLHTTFEGQESIEGSIYLDFESDEDMLGRNNILYGHNMKNGTMFKDVVKYKDPEFFKEHQYFSIYTPEREIRLKAVAAYYGAANPIVRKTRFKTRESYDAFVTTMLSYCPYAEIPEVPLDSLYLLVTCSYEIDDARTYLYAVQVDENGQVIAAQDPQEGFYELAE